MRKLFMFLLIPLYLFSMGYINKKRKKSPCARKCKNCLHVAVRQHGTNEYFTQHLQECIEAGCSVNDRDKNGKTPLHIAVEMHYLGVARFLVHCGADLSIRDKKKRRPLDIIQLQIEKEEQKECKSCKILLSCFKNLLTQRSNTI